MGNLQSLLVLIKGLPLAYNRDLQEDKLALFDALDTVTACLELVPAIVIGATLNVDRINARIEEGFLDATALMEYLIQQGVPMRTGHETVGKLVALAESRCCRLADLPLDEFQKACADVDETVYSVLGTQNAVGVLQSYGSGGREPVAVQLSRWRERLGLA
jgi:argininosuccinate lyase